jgi:hypothetical protein
LLSQDIGRGRRQNLCVSVPLASATTSEASASRRLTAAGFTPNLHLVAGRDSHCIEIGAIT